MGRLILRDAQASRWERAMTPDESDLSESIAFINTGSYYLL
jgi:hypothetical protein